MNVSVSDVHADRFEDTERKLKAWGEACRRNSAALGMPTISSFAATAAHIRRKTIEQREARRRALKDKHRQARKAEEPVDPKEVAELKGFTDPPVTARGKETQTLDFSGLQVSSDIARTDAVVRRLPGWMHKCVVRSYLYGQPDRIAAFDLRMPDGEYAQRRRAAVIRVAEQLDAR